MNECVLSIFLITFKVQSFNDKQANTQLGTQSLFDLLIFSLSVADCQLSLVAHRPPSPF